ncbi:MAG TPA: hypothetical protein VM261_02025 [Kofleriaceae bacterium]|nr:hypothetical protein [Kofleriaceae bacterium]
MIRRAPRICLPILMIAACSGSGDPDDNGGVDAASGIDAVPRTCTVVSDLGQLGARDGTPAASGAAGSRIVSVSMTVASDAATRDVVFVQLKGGKGAFAGRDPAPGVYPLTGAELDYSTCGVCVTVIGDIVAGQGPTQFYFQRAGTVTITSAAGSLVGSLSGMELLELDLATEELVRDGCETQVGGLTFDEALP